MTGSYAGPARRLFLGREAGSVGYRLAAGFGLVYQDDHPPRTKAEIHGRPPPGWEPCEFYVPPHLAAVWIADRIMRISDCVTWSELGWDEPPPQELFLDTPPYPWGDMEPGDSLLLAGGEKKRRQAYQSGVRWFARHRPDCKVTTRMVPGGVHVSLVKVEPPKPKPRRAPWRPPPWPQDAGPSPGGPPMGGSFYEQEEAMFYYLIVLHDSDGFPDVHIAPATSYESALNGLLRFIFVKEVGVESIRKIWVASDGEAAELPIEQLRIKLADDIADAEQSRFPLKATMKAKGTVRKGGDDEG